MKTTTWSTRLTRSECLVGCGSWPSDGKKNRRQHAPQSDAVESPCVLVLVFFATEMKQFTGDSTPASAPMRSEPETAPRLLPPPISSSSKKSSPLPSAPLFPRPPPSPTCGASGVDPASKQGHTYARNEKRIYYIKKSLLEYCSCGTARVFNRLSATITSPEDGSGLELRVKTKGEKV